VSLLRSSEQEGCFTPHGVYLAGDPFKVQDCLTNLLAALPVDKLAKVLDSQEDFLNNEYHVSQRIAVNLPDLKAELERLKVLTEQLPPESEVSGLLRQIQGLVNKAGLSLKLWKPDKRRTHSSGMYEEIPITLKLTGGYHNVALFFDSVSKLTRIVNMLNLKMYQPKMSKSGTMEIGIDCTAMTFAAVETKVETPIQPKATKKVK
jgi:type IV pilus assembly protein PilO